MKHIKLMFFTIFFVIVTAISSFAANYSPNWYQENGYWKIRDAQGNIITNTRLYDNINNHWYILDANGNMVVCELIQDSKGNYYSLETSPNENYGALRCQSGYYNGVFLDIDSSSGVIKNQDGINTLKNGKCGVFFINHNNFAYTSNNIAVSNSASSNVDDNVELDMAAAVAYIRQVLPSFPNLYITIDNDSGLVIRARGFEKLANIDAAIKFNHLLCSGTDPNIIGSLEIYPRNKANIRAALQKLSLVGS